ncbi:AraC family transcriptional regulator [Novosphingobium percolationis]|uniref:AraC family transcriptional regulator n=1 Tax=Novosphingobium percolationis TaxID=2871811 RepID=UPI001CD4362C|nr:AraC family transcriptional regulator [Novosphingobium percolationis]
MDERLAVLRALCSDGPDGQTRTAIPRLAVMRWQQPDRTPAADHEATITLVLQGYRTLSIGDDVLRFGPGSCLVTSMDRPAAGSVSPESDGRAYLALSLTLDPQIVEAVICEAEPAKSRPQTPGTAPDAPVNLEMLDAWARLLRLRGCPADIPMLAPGYEREIIYRALLGPQGPLLCAIATPDRAYARIRRSIQQIRTRFAQPLAVAELAHAASLSPSAFHRQFKAVTTLSPVQFQKHLRLLRARSVLVASGAGVAAVGREVGYDNVSQFTREYARLFGLPPATDRNRIKRELGTHPTGVATFRDTQ